MAIEIRKSTPMLPTRPCKYCLSLQDDSVFADFDVDGDDRVFLVRISYDGFGCCLTKGETSRMSSEISQLFRELVESEEVNSDQLSSILTGYFHDNAELIWIGALIEHRLLPGMKGPS